MIIIIPINDRTFVAQIFSSWNKHKSVLILTLTDEKTFSFSAGSYSVVKSEKNLTVEVQLKQRIARFVSLNLSYTILLLIIKTLFHVIPKA